MARPRFVLLSLSIIQQHMIHNNGVSTAEQHILDGGHVERSLSNTWLQVHNDIDGDNNLDESGFSISMSANGKRIAIGAHKNSYYSTDSGQVRVFEEEDSAGTWLQVHNDIYGKASGDQSGYAVALSGNGLRVAIGSPFNDGVTNNQNFGHVRIFEDSGSAWVQVHDDLEGTTSGEESGRAVSLSDDGSRVAIGTPDFEGYVRIFDDSGTAWVKVHSDIVGEGYYDLSGTSVSLSANGQRIAIGSPYNSDNGGFSGKVRIYQDFGSSWVRIDSDSLVGEADGDEFGKALALSANGNRVAIGVPYSSGNGLSSGHVRVFQFLETTWIQVHDDIDGEASGDQSGYSVAISANGRRVMIGAPFNSNVNGHVRIFEDNLVGAWVQVNDDIDGEANGDQFGYSVAMSADGLRVGVGAYLNDGNGQNSGHVRVFEDVENTASPTATPTATTSPTILPTSTTSPSILPTTVQIEIPWKFRVYVTENLTHYSAFIGQKLIKEVEKSFLE